MGVRAALRAPEDFVVEEIPLYPPSGEGGHTFLWVEKRLRTTEEVARWLAAHAGVSARDVGYAGRKDRYALTRQSFSVPGLAPDAAIELSEPGIRVLRAVRHGHKLRTGQLAGNRFDLRISELDASSCREALARCAEIARSGMPNRFGRQRFGHQGANVERGRRLLRGQSAGKNRRQARFLVSAFQAAVFNEVLRTRLLPLDRVEEGDLARRTDSGGLFVVEDEQAENFRAERFEISATGPIFGARMDEPGPRVAAREREVLASFGVALETLRPPRGVRVRGARRALRAPVRDLRVDRPSAEAPDASGATPARGESLRLRFDLPPGSYATVLLESLLGLDLTLEPAAPQTDVPSTRP